MWAPICQVGTWQGMFGEVEITHEKLDSWINAFGRDEKIPATRGHMADPENQHASTDTPALCWISGLMKAGDLLLGNFVDWTPEGFEAVSSGGYKNVSIESRDGSRLDSVAFLGARTPGVDFHSANGRFAPLDMAGECLGDVGKVVLAQSLAALGEPVALPYKNPPKKITDLFEDEAGPGAWTKAFNAAYEEYDGDEAKANGTAWATIKKMGYVKGDDGKYRKSKTAAGAANQGGKMSLKEKVLAALKDLTVKLEGEPEEGAEPAKPEPIAAADLAPGIISAKELPEFKAMADRIEKLEGQLVMSGAMSQARELCEAAHIAPKFEAPMAQYMAGKPEITLAEPERDNEGNVTKEYKLSRNDFFATVLVSKGTEKLDDPKKLADAPTRKPVSPFVATGNKFMPDDPAEQQVLAEKAKALARTEGKTIQEATAVVLAAWQKEQED